MPDYVVNTPEREYKGKTYGVQFEKGSAAINGMTVPKHLNRSADEVATLMKRDFGYDVKEAGQTSTFAVPDLPWKDVKTNLGDAVGAWKDVSKGERLVHDDYGPVTVTKVNQKSLRLRASNDEVVLERDLEVLTRLKS